MSDDEPTPAAALTSGGHGRRATAALAVTVVLGTTVFLLAADRLARWGAESVMARAVQERTGVSEPPSVKVHGSPVLLQALRGRYDDVRVEIPSLSSGPLRMRDYTADLGGVYLSFQDLLDRIPDRLYIEESDEQARLTYDDFDRYLGFVGRPLDAEPGGNGQMRLTGSIDVLGEIREVSALARVESEDGALIVRPTRLEAADPLEGVAELLVRQRFTFPVPLDPLLFEDRPTEVLVEPSGLLVRTTGRGVVLGS